MRTPKVPHARSLKKTLANALLFTASCVVVLVLGEFVLRLRYSEPSRTPTPEVVAIQRHLQLHPRIGFTWNTNVAQDQDIVIEVAGAESQPLSTGEFGFLNHPAAIESVKAGEAVDIVGLGDSFMEHASHNFHEFFKSNGLAYYGMAVHRQAPPHYNVILEDHALPLRPKWILYGLFENDFMETADFDRWRVSGLNWFTFHSGTWCGPPVAVSALARFKDRHLRGFGGLYHVLHARLRGERMTLTGPTRAEIERVLQEIRRANDLATASGAAFVLVLIPSRATALAGSSPESEAYDALLNELDGAPLTLIDLRAPFIEHETPASLYYEIDAHWNRAGMDLAANTILDAIGRNSASLSHDNAASKLPPS